MNQSRRGKPIFDPHEKAEADATQRRNSYTIFRVCGHCRGTGRRKDDLLRTVSRQAQCSQCLLNKSQKGRIDLGQGGQIAWGQHVELFAFELTGEEMNQLTPEKRLGAYCEQSEHLQRRHIARIAADVEFQSQQTVVVMRMVGSA